MRQKSSNELGLTALWQFIKHPAQRKDILFCFVLSLIGYIVIRVCYPYPATALDSFGYIDTAMRDRFSFYRPFGYSMFLQFLRRITSSANAVFIVQMLLHFVTTTLFLLTIKFYYPIKSIVLRYLGYLLVVFNPVSIYMANALMSDMLFSASIYLLLTMIIIYLKSTSRNALLISLIALFVALFVRYSGMFFPVVTLPVLLMVKDRSKWIGVVGTALVFSFFYYNITNNMEKAVRMRQFSTGFSGWSWANNALHIVPFIDLEMKDIDDPYMQKLHGFISMNKETILERTNGGKDVVVDFLWSGDMPLKQYLYVTVQKSKRSYPESWVALGTLYGKYGQYLAMHYPLEFWKYYLYPNMKCVFFPAKVEMLTKYSVNEVIDPTMAEWFKLPKDLKIQENYPLYNNGVNRVIPYYELLTWLILLFSLGVLVWKGRSFKISRTDGLVLSMLIAFGFVYYGSITVASVIAVRYWIPMSMLKIVVPMIVLYLYEHRESKLN